MVFGHKASKNILPWLRNNYTKRLLIQGSYVFLSHPQNIKFSYTLEHARNYVETFRAIMALLGVDIPPLDGHVQLRFLLTKKRALEMMEYKIKIERTAKVEELQEEARQRKEVQEIMNTATVVEIEEHARQRKKEQEEQARQRKEEQAKQAPKARGKYKTFDDRIEDLKRFKEMHGHANVSICEDKPLAQFCVQVRYARNNPSKSKRKQLTIENISRLDSLGFVWTTQEYVTRSFDERIEDLREYKQKQQPLSILCGRQALTKTGRERWHEEADGRAHSEA